VSGLPGSNPGPSASYSQIASAVVLVLLVAFALVATAFARSRP
jgi:succinate dehydrogenase hydrophobic anchor subunit